MFDTSSPGKQNDTFIELNLKTCPKIVSQVRKSQTRSKKARAREREEMKGRKKKRISEQIVIEKQAVTLYKGGNESKCMEYQ